MTMHPAFAVIASGVALAACAATTATAQSWPARPVRVIIPFPPGGGSDLLGRPVAQKLTDAFGQQFIVDNRGGANGIIGTDLAARSRPDGYTLLVGSTAMSSNASLYHKLPYDTLNSFAPISLFGNMPYFLATNPSLPVTSVKELVALAKAQPGKINFGSAGVGGTPHLSGEMFNAQAGVKLVHVPYKGAAESIIDLIAGQVQVMFTGLPALGPHARAGKLRLIAVAQPARSPLMPDVPTFAESGLQGFEVGSWFGIFSPAGVPPALQARLAAEIARAVQSKEVQERYLGGGVEPLWNTPDQFRVFFRDDVVKWAKVVKESGARAE